MAYVGFDAKTVPPASSFELLPRGKYLAICTESEVKTNSAKTGEYLKLTFEIVDGSYKGRKLYDQLNIRHPNPKAVEIALSTLSALCHAVNVLELGDSAMLHDLPVILDVGVEKGREGYEDRNRIYGYLNAKENPGGPSLTPPFKPAGSPRLTAWGTKKPDPKPLDDDVPF